MSRSIKNVIGLMIALVLAAFASSVFLGSGGEATIWNFGVKVNPRVEAAREAPAAASPQLCRLPEHGIEAWGKTERWNADSGWRGGGSNPTEYCGAQKLKREAKYPEREVVLLDTGEKHKTVRNPFKHDYYRYTCVFEDRWDPLYKLAANPKCST